MNIMSLLSGLVLVGLSLGQAWAGDTIFYNTDRQHFEYADGRLVPHDKRVTAPPGTP